MREEHNYDYSTCPIRNVLANFGDKWSLLVLYHLHLNGTMRFNKLNREMMDCSQKMLSATLRRLEQLHLVSRKVYPEVPPKVEYKLTETGQSLMPHVDSLVGWALNHWDIVKSK